MIEEDSEVLKQSMQYHSRCARRVTTWALTRATQLSSFSLLNSGRLVNSCLSLNALQHDLLSYNSIEFL